MELRQQREELASQLKASKCVTACFAAVLAVEGMWVQHLSHVASHLRFQLWKVVDEQIEVAGHADTEP